MSEVESALAGKIAVVTGASRGARRGIAKVLGRHGAAGGHARMYGFRTHGWVTVTLAARSRPDVGLLRDWIDESSLTVAPKGLAQRLHGTAEH